LLTAGRTVIVLEQTEPLRGKDLPVAGIDVAGAPQKRRSVWAEFADTGGSAGSISFPVAIAHPVLKGLTERDFFTWAGDEENFLLSYATPATGVISIIQAGNALTLTPMMEIPVGQGSLLLSQMTIGRKLGVEPVADRLLHNILCWAAARSRAEPGRTLVLLDGDRKLGEFIGRTNVLSETVDTVQEALVGDVAVVRATPRTLDQLASARDEVHRFCRKGGWLMLVGVDQGGLEAFNRLVGFEHRMRTFGREAAGLAQRNDPLLLGLTDRDMRMTSDKVLAHWLRLTWISDRVFTTVVDGAEIAAFGGAPPNVTNGLTNEDFWRYIEYFSDFDPDGAQFELKFDRPETIAAIRIKPTAAPYFFLKDVEFIFDGDAANPVKFTCQQVEGTQDVEMEPRRAQSITVKLIDHWPGESSKNTVGIDLLEVYRKLPDEPVIVLLTRPAGLVKYAIGRGGIVLNQLDYGEADIPAGTRPKDIPNQIANVTKKIGIYANLLRNMGSSFKVSMPLEGE